jgi:dTDP-4-dehydrorhamnose 3,5-epimerase
VDVRHLAIAQALVFTPRQFIVVRGVFLEWYRIDVLERASGRTFTAAQANHSVSRRGAVRGIHFTDVPPGTAKYVYCPSGAVLDVVVDLRTGSPTFGRWESVRLDDVDRRGLYLGEGLGHGLIALSDNAMVTYLCSSPYAAERERGIHPLDPDLGIDWPVDPRPLLSVKDSHAPSLREAWRTGLLPSYEMCVTDRSRQRAAVAERPA